MFAEQNMEGMERIGATQAALHVRVCVRVCVCVCVCVCFTTYTCVSISLGHGVKRSRH